jgi:hypothetical protein
MRRNAILLALLLLPASLFASDVTGVFAPGQRYEAPADHAPANVSRMFVRAVTRETSSVDLPATGGGGMLIWTIAASKNAARHSARLTTPTGDVLHPRDNGSIERGLRRFNFDATEVGIDLPAGTEEVLHVQQTVAASYRLDVELPGDVPGALVVVAEPDSPIAMETWVTPLSRQPGEPVTLFAKLTGEAGSARVTARLGGDTIELTAANGVYTATLSDLPKGMAGLQQVRFEADGETSRGARFARSGSSEFVAERGAARLDRDSIRASRAGDVLRVTAAADVAIAGSYRFDVIVASNGTALAWGEGLRQLDRGANELTIDIPLDASARNLHLDVRLLDLETMGVAGRAAADVHPRTETME